MERKKAIIPRVGYLVKRFHTIPILVEETVGHHSANVALLCDFITDGECSKTVLLAALKHDIPEQWTGDVPAPAKWSNPEFADILAEVEERWTITTGYDIPKLQGDELLVLKAADMLDLCFKCVEELNMGNSSFLPIFINGINYLDGLPLQGAAGANVKDIVTGLKVNVGMIEGEPYEQQTH